ncbi:MAG: MBL fold metallo-hydrolase [Proteobacteria bacterium]|nr:MBL fold metallo-hydrolase [Pseudomonadota bacterium]
MNAIERAAGLRRERARSSPRWAGNGFRNVQPVLPGLRVAGSPLPTVSEFLFRRGRRIPEAALPSVDPREGWRRAPDDGLRATWLGHSTVLVEIDGARLLTDPVWGPRASPSRFIGPKRFQPVPVPLSGLPSLDAVVISHDHYDHLDYPTIRALRQSAVPFVTALGVGAHLERWGIEPGRITELDWWETHRVPGTDVHVTAAPAQHFSGRSLHDRNATLWASMLFRGPRHAAFFSGDTGLTHEYAVIRERLGPFDLVMLEIGAYHPAWGDIHLGPDHALEAHALLGGGTLLPVHWGTFSLALHDWDQPVERLVEQAGRRNAPLLLPRLGEPMEPGREMVPAPWWRDVRRSTEAVERESAEPEPGVELLGAPVD